MNSISSVEFHIFCGKCTFNQNLWKAGFHYNVDKLMENTFSMNSTNSMEIFPSFRFTIRTPGFHVKSSKVVLFSVFLQICLFTSVVVCACAKLSNSIMWGTGKGKSGIRSFLCDITMTTPDWWLLKIMELKVWVEGIQRIVCGVTDKTTCQVSLIFHFLSAWIKKVFLYLL